MNKYLKILIINTILLTSFILNIKTNVSYSQDINDMDEFFNSGIEIRKFVAFHDNVELINEMKKKIGQIEGLAVSSSFVDNIEITDYSAQKGLILVRFRQRKFPFIKIIF